MNRHPCLHILLSYSCDLKFADTLSPDYVTIECFFKTVRGKPHLYLLVIKHLVIKVLSSIQGLSKATQCPRVQRQPPICRQIPQVPGCWGLGLTVAMAGKVCQNSKGMQGFEMCPYKWKRWSGERRSSALLNRSNPQLVAAALQNIIRHFYLFVYFETSPPREGTATHNGMYVCPHPLYTSQF